MSADLSDELYRATVGRMMESHAARILQLASVCGASLAHAPTAPWLRFLGGHTRELTDLFAELSTRYETVTAAPLAPPSLERREDHAPPLPRTWPESLAALLVAGRQLRWQLHEHDLCSYAPYRDFVARAVASLDARHARLDAAFAELRDAPDGADAHAHLAHALDAWMLWAAESFGRPNTPGMAYSIRVGLRRRDAGATWSDLLEDLRAMARATTVPLPPQWMPEPERPSFLAALHAITRESSPHD